MSGINGKTGSIEWLESCRERLLEYHEFTPGDIVRLKDAHIGYYRTPRAGKPAIVMSVLPEPVPRKITDTGDARYGDHVDMSIGVADPDGDFLVYHVASKYFEPYEA